MRMHERHQQMREQLELAHRSSAAPGEAHLVRLPQPLIALGALQLRLHHPLFPIHHLQLRLQVRNLPLILLQFVLRAGTAPQSRAARRSRQATLRMQPAGWIT